MGHYFSVLIARVTMWRTQRKKKTMKLKKLANWVPQAAPARSVAVPLTVQYVQLSPAVMLKITNHCHNEGSGTMDVVQGALLGIVLKDCLEITDCFPFPRLNEESRFEQSSTKQKNRLLVGYQLDMMNNLRLLNVDILHVGWYQSAYLGGFMSSSMVDSLCDFQLGMKESVVLIYDPLKTARGSPSLRAFQLSATAMRLHRESNKSFAFRSVLEARMRFEDIFDEIPVVLKNSNLTKVLLCEMKEMTVGGAMPDPTLNMSTAPVLERNLSSLCESMDQLNLETVKVVNHLKQKQKQKQARNLHRHNRVEENLARAASGEPPLPKEDLDRLFRPINPPSRLESMVCAGQIQDYCKEVDAFVAQSFKKLFISKSLQNE